MVLNVHRNVHGLLGTGRRGVGGGMEVGEEGDYIPIATRLSPPELMTSALRWAVMRAILVS